MATKPPTGKPNVKVKAATADPDEPNGNKLAEYVANTDPCRNCQRHAGMVTYNHYLAFIKTLSKKHNLFWRSINGRASKRFVYASVALLFSFHLAIVGFTYIVFENQHKLDLQLQGQVKEVQHLRELLDLENKIDDLYYRVGPNGNVIKETVRPSAPSEAEQKSGSDPGLDSDLPEQSGKPTLDQG